MFNLGIKGIGHEGVPIREFETRPMHPFDVSLAEPSGGFNYWHNHPEAVNWVEDLAELYYSPAAGYPPDRLDRYNVELRGRVTLNQYPGESAANSGKRHSTPYTEVNGLGRYVGGEKNFARKTLWPKRYAVVGETHSQKKERRYRYIYPDDYNTRVFTQDLGALGQGSGYTWGGYTYRPQQTWWSRLTGWFSGTPTYRTQRYSRSMYGGRWASSWFNW